MAKLSPQEISILDVSLHVFLPPSTLQRALCSHAFGQQRDEARGQPAEFRDFFDCYAKKLGQLSMRPIGAKSCMLDHIAAKSHLEILQIYQILLANNSSDKIALRRAVRDQQNFRLTDDEAIDMSLDLAARLWLNLNIRHSKWKFSEIRKMPIQWPIDLSINELVATLFPRTKTKLSAKESRLSVLFNAAYLVKTCGLTVEWTDDLHDHLLLDRSSRALQVFADQAFLSGHIGRRIYEGDKEPMYEASTCK